MKKRKNLNRENNYKKRRKYFHKEKQHPSSKELGLTKQYKELGLTKQYKEEVKNEIQEKQNPSSKDLGLTKQYKEQVNNKKHPSSKELGLTKQYKEQFKNEIQEKKHPSSKELGLTKQSKEQVNNEIQEKLPFTKELRIKKFKEHMELARCREVEGDTVLACEEYKASLNIFPKSVEAHLNIAKLIRFDANSQESLDEVEEHLEAALKYSKESHSPKSIELGTLALTRLVLQLYQEGKDAKASSYLSSNGFYYRLSSPVLCYQNSSTNQPTDESIIPSEYVKVVDGALPPDMLSHMKMVFGKESKFWLEHNYNSETTGYFSYLHSLDHEPENSMDQIIHHLHHITLQYFPEVKLAKYAEWWAHCRAHPSGHQLHFDSDNEGIGGVRNPIISTVICVEGGIGGPTLVTTQKLTDKKLADKGWLIFPEENRFVMFCGNVLHGVIPGKSFPLHPTQRRITFMIAFWKDIPSQPSEDEGPRANKPFPDPQTTQYTWPKLMIKHTGFGTKGPLKEVFPVPVTPIWEDVNPNVNEAHSCSVKSLQFLPNYDLCFQGF